MGAMLDYINVRKLFKFSGLQNGSFLVSRLTQKYDRTFRNSSFFVSNYFCTLIHLDTITYLVLNIPCFHRDAMQNVDYLKLNR